MVCTPRCHAVPTVYPFQFNDSAKCAQNIIASSRSPSRPALNPQLCSRCPYQTIVAHNRAKLPYLQRFTSTLCPRIILMVIQNTSDFVDPELLFLDSYCQGLHSNSVLTKSTQLTYAVRETKILGQGRLRPSEGSTNCFSHFWGNSIANLTPTRN